MQMKKSCASLALALFCIAAPSQAQDTGPAAAEITVLTGRGTASSPDGSVRILALGDAVYPGEVISSGINSYVNLKFADGGLVLLRPKTRFEIQEFVYPGGKPALAAATAPEPAKPAAPQPPKTKAEIPTAPAKSAATPSLPPPPGGAALSATTAPAQTESGASRAFFRLLKGGFRAVSGLIGKTDHNEYRVTTPVATIGIRGTDYFAEIIDAAFARDPVLRATLPPGVSAEGGLFVKQYEGSTTITNNQGQQTFVNPNEHVVTLPNGNQIFVPLPDAIKANPPESPAQIKCKTTS